MEEERPSESAIASVFRERSDVNDMRYGSESTSENTTH
jgi:hypothetical protein